MKMSVEYITPVRGSIDTHIHTKHLAQLSHQSLHGAGLSGSERFHVATHLLVLVLVGLTSSKMPKALVVSNQIAVKCGRIVLKIKTSTTTHPS